MPYVVIGLLLGGLLVAGFGRRRLLYAYVGVFLAVAIAGLYDFWRWEYDYGHDLDPTAAIRIPGMSYQPPLIGGKQLLNFHAIVVAGRGRLGGHRRRRLIVVVAALEWRASRSSAGLRAAPAALSGMPGSMLA